MSKKWPILLISFSWAHWSPVRTNATPRHERKKIMWEVNLAGGIVLSCSYQREIWKWMTNPFEVSCILSVLWSELVFVTVSRYCSFEFGQFSLWSYVIAWDLTRLTNEAEVILKCSSGRRHFGCYSEYLCYQCLLLKKFSIWHTLPFPTASHNFFVSL